LIPEFAGGQKIFHFNEKFLRTIKEAAMWGDIESSSCRVVAPEFGGRQEIFHAEVRFLEAR